MFDYILCCNCDYEGTVETATDQCPNCKYIGALAWVEGEPQEVEKEIIKNKGV